MADVVTVGKAISTLIAIFSKFYKAKAHRGIGQEEVDALQELMGGLGHLKGGLPESEEPDHGLEGRYQALVLGAFLRAWVIFHASESVVSPSRWRFARASRELSHEVRLRVESAVGPGHGANLLQSDVALMVSLAEMLESPINSRWYRALWQEFAEPRPRHDGPGSLQPLLEPKDRLKFERHFLLAWWQLLESAVGEPLKRDQTAAGAIRRHLMQQLILTDMALWGQRHVFGTEPGASAEDTALPSMPLEEMYVEPDALVEGYAEGAQRAPVTETIESLLSVDKKIIVVVANFGHGKSLTARTLASRWAGRFLTAGTPTVADRLPVFVRCAECLTAPPDIARSVRQSNKRRAEMLDAALDLDSEDVIYSPPDPTQGAVYIYDGLDEVVWGHDSLRQFFRVLTEKASAKQRFVIFSRPDVVPNSEDLDGVTVVRLLPFRMDGANSQVASWLNRWNRILPAWLDARKRRGLEVKTGTPLTAKALKSADLLKLAATPILLFLIAYGHALSGELGESRAALYEDFFWHMARGKFERDSEHHPRVKKASEDLSERLKRMGILEESTEAPMAMLWLMARVAWESSRKEWNRRLKDIREGARINERLEQTTLVRRDVEIILSQELGIHDENAIKSIQVGMLLTLQADLRDENHQILYGHQSFREFLIARYWADRLGAALRGSSRQREDALKYLAGGRLMGGEDKSVDFLKDILLVERGQRREGSPLGWTVGSRLELSALSWEGFLREDPLFDGTPGQGTRSIEDRRPPFRESMLAIASLLRPVSISTPEETQSLRAILGYFWHIHEAASLRLSHASLQVELDGADLHGADFEGAKFNDSSLVRTDLSRANLSGARLAGVYLYLADLSHANLERANLVGAKLHSSTMLGAQLKGANLEGASVTNANLSGATLQNANLEGATLTGTNLSGASLNRANLTGANLSGASLEGANLTGATLFNASYDRYTRWPENFDPDSQGAHVVYR